MNVFIERGARLPWLTERRSNERAEQITQLQTRGAGELRETENAARRDEINIIKAGKNHGNSQRWRALKSEVS